MKIKFVLLAVFAAGVCLCAAMQAQGQAKLIAKGKVTESRAGLYADLSGLDYNLEDGAPANLLGGLGSAFTWGYGDTFLARKPVQNTTESANQLCRFALWLSRTALSAFED